MGKNQKKKEAKGQVITFHQSAEFFYERGMKAYRRNDLQVAIKYLRRAAHTEQPFILCQLASALSEAGEYYESNQILTSVIRKDPSMKDCYYFMANNYAYLGLFQQAKKYAERYLEVAEDEEFVEETLDLLDIIADEGEESDELVDEDELIVMQEKANSYIRNGELSEAIATLETIIAEYPEFWSAYNNLAVARFQIGEVEEALSIVNTVLEKNPGNLHALCNTVIFLYSIEEDEKVKKIADQLEDVHPILIEHRFKLGTMFATIGRFESAYKWLKSLKRTGYEGDFSFYHWLAYSAYMTGDTQTAEKTWKHVVAMYPDKEGKEPWLYPNFGNSDAQILLVQLKRAFEAAETIEEKMLALYLLNELQTDEKIGVFFEIAQTFRDVPAISEWAQYFLLKTTGKSIPKELKAFEECAQISNILYGYTKKEDFLIEECLHLWFSTFIELFHINTCFENALGWSAAIEYIVRNEKKHNMTQAEIGNLYNVSVATVRKYAQAIKRARA
ncbi:tetratricopeptide repeat protein [Microbacteriaceae bacterium 4G12]